MALLVKVVVGMAMAVAVVQQVACNKVIKLNRVVSRMAFVRDYIRLSL